MTRTEEQERPATLTIPEASRALGFGRSLGYDLAAKNQFPCRVIKAGARYIVPRIEVERLLGITIGCPSPDDVR